MDEMGRRVNDKENKQESRKQGEIPLCLGSDQTHLFDLL